MKAVGVHDASSIIQLSPEATPGYTHAEGLREGSASKASELLTLNHSLYHFRFNGGFHNHLAHHLLALWALGASPDEMQDQWEYNTPYQAPIEKSHAAASRYLDLEDPVLFDRCLGDDDSYLDFLRFFENEIAEKGMQGVIREYLLKGDDRANDIFCRMYTDLVHQIIHLGYALEFKQPSLVAETLAAACVHDNWPKDFLLPTEEHVRSNADVSTETLLSVLSSLQRDPTITSAVKDTDPFNKVRDGLLKRVGAKELVPYLSRFQVQPTPEDLHRKMEDMMHTCAYMLGAAQRPGKSERMDFVLLHNVTLSVFYPVILSQDWLTNEEKARLLEAKARVDAVMYASCRCPTLYPDRIVEYVPRRPTDGWKELFHRSIVHRDEGHVVKLVRSLYSLEALGETAEGFPLRKRDFVKIAHMAVDSVERAFETDGHTMPEDVAQGVVDQVGQGGEMVKLNMMRWVYYGGLNNAWDYVPDLKVSPLAPIELAELRYIGSN